MSVQGYYRKAEVEFKAEHYREAMESFRVSMQNMKLQTFLFLIVWYTSALIIFGTLFAFIASKLWMYTLTANLFPEICILIRT